MKNHARNYFRTLDENGESTNTKESNGRKSLTSSLQSPDSERDQEEFDLELNKNESNSKVNVEGI